MSNDIESNKQEVKLVIARMLEIAYSKDSGLTSNILMNSRNATLTIDQEGQVSLSSSLGILVFNGDSAINSMGIAFKRVKVIFSNSTGMNVGYSVNVSLFSVSFGFRGSIDLKKLMTACSGLLCRAARLLSSRRDQLDSELLQAMGR